MWLKDNLYIDRTEVTNVNWREFLSYIKQLDSIHLYDEQQFLLDTSVWYSLNRPNYSIYYHTHPSFNNYPVVGVSYEQATTFCKWRTDRVNELIQKKINTQWKFKKINYRLPTNEEWEFAASNSLNPEQYPFGFELQQEKIGDRIFYHWPEFERPNFENRILTIPVNSLPPNSFGAYNLLGNVSEMITMKGISKGGNFTLQLDSCKIRQLHPYTKPEAWLGFRCICEVLE